MLGNVYHDSYDEESCPPKPKFYIVVGLCDDKEEFATIYINSEINKFLQSTDLLYSLQYPLSPEDLKFLDHDSFADCSNLKTRCTVPFNRKIKEGNVELMTTLSDKMIQEIKNIVKSSGVISNFYLGKFNI